MRAFYRLMLGRQSLYAKECFERTFIGVDFGITEAPTIPNSR